MEWDAIIIGTGMGGAPLGYALARAGQRVLFLEKGRSHLQPGALTNSYAENHFPAPAAPGPEHRATLQRAGLNDYQVSLYPWARAYDMALREPGVLIYLIARTSEREALFRWVGEIMRIDYHFYKLRERDDIRVPDLEAAKAYRIGVMRDDVRHQYLQANGFSKIVVSAHNSDNFKRLVNGQVDLVPMPEHDMLALCAEAGVDPATVEKVFSPHTSTQLYMAYSRQTDDDTVLRTQAAFEHLQAEGEVARIMAGQP